MKTITLDISGMTCAACVGRVERGLKKVEGVLEAQVNLATGATGGAAAPRPARRALLRAPRGGRVPPHLTPPARPVHLGPRPAGRTERSSAEPLTTRPFAAERDMMTTHRDR